jgi:hypothetical protein
VAVAEDQVQMREVLAESVVEVMADKMELLTLQMVMQTLAVAVAE